MSVEIKDPQNTVVLTGDAVIHVVKTPPQAEARICPQCHELTWRRSWTCMWCGHDRLRTLYAVVVCTLLPMLLIAHIVDLFR